METPWHVVYTYPHAERQIAATLAEKNIVNYLPMQKVVRQWSDRKKKLNVPLFPNYVFVQVSRIDRYKVLSVPRIARFVSLDGEPVILHEKELASIRLLNDSNCEITNEQFFKDGDRVRVTNGPLKGLEGMLMEKNRGKRFYMRFDSIEQAISVTVESRFLERV